MARVLIVWEATGENTELYIVDAYGSELMDLELASGNYINASEDDDAEEAVSRVSTRLAVVWSDNRFDSEKMLDVSMLKIEKVVVTGII